MDAPRTHALKCACGTVRGSVGQPELANRAICYCRDCQAFAHFLGRPGEILDARGGSDVIQILPQHLTFTQGIESVTCMRLTPNGLVRWHTSCCRTPIGNTLANPKLAFIGLLHNCLESAERSLDQSFGPVRTWVNTKSARGEPKPKSAGLGRTLGWFIRTVLRARLNGNYRLTPLFTSSGELIVTPRVLSSVERSELMRAVEIAGQ